MMDVCSAAVGDEMMSYFEKNLSKNQISVTKRKKSVTEEAKTSQLQRGRGRVALATTRRSQGGAMLHFRERETTLKRSPAHIS